MAARADVRAEGGGVEAQRRSEDGVRRLERGLQGAVASGHDQCVMRSFTWADWPPRPDVSEFARKVADHNMLWTMVTDELQS